MKNSNVTLEILSTPAHCHLDRRKVGGGRSGNQSRFKPVIQLKLGVDCRVLLVGESISIVKSLCYRRDRGSER
jgi:hypothetical protein